MLHYIKFVNQFIKSISENIWYHSITYIQPNHTKYYHIVQNHTRYYPYSTKQDKTLFVHYSGLKIRIFLYASIPYIELGKHEMRNILSVRYLC